MWMKKPKYFFDQHSLEFKKVTTSAWTKFAKAMGFLSASVVMGIILLFVFIYTVDSPKEKELKREIKQYKAQITTINKRITEHEEELEFLAGRDEQLYRVVFEAKPLPRSVRNAGYGGVDKYKTLEGYNNSAAIIELTKRIDKLSKQLYIQSKSYDELAKLAARKQDMLASIPAIQPVSNKNLKRMASGYGYRIHPIYKRRMMHSGMDFSADRGTPIYATGNGKVTTAGRNAGYGICVIINHGYGYESLYGHMSKIEVRYGATVKRGQLIGYVGSTGRSTAPHLHYEIIKNDKKINPVNFFYNDLSPEEYDKVREIAAQDNQSFD